MLSASLAFSASCKTTSNGSVETGATKTSTTSALFVSPKAHDFTQNPALLERIRVSPHGYFRFINVDFSREVCRRFAPLTAQMPTVNLHGDAHLEQYAVTTLGRGLTDFDDSSTGPGIIDLLRFGVSLRLTAEAHGWSDRSPALYERFLAGYRMALENPDFEAEEPEIATRIRAKFKFDRSKYFEWIESIMKPISAADQAAFERDIEPYISAMLKEDPKRTPAFFKVKQIGRLQMGIGSALDLKYLIRVEGATEAPSDDVILEAKQVRDLSGIDCIQGSKSDAFRILVGQSRIAYRPFEFLGYARHQGLMLWIHSWVDNYKELKIDKSFESVEELGEVVYDIGVQLGRGHPNQIAAPLDLQLRQAQLQVLNEQKDLLIKTCGELTVETLAAWEQFRKAAKK